MATPAKPDAAAAKAPAKEGEAPAAAGAAAAAPAAAKGGIMSWVPVIAALLLAPVATWATVEFVMLPRLQKKLAAAPAEGEEGHAEEAAHAEPAEKPAHGGGEKKPAGGHGGKSEGGAPNYQFENVVVNLAGTMGTRYLKTNIYVVGKDANIKSLFENDKPRLTDITQSVLASLTLADIEEAGSRNIIRAKLINAYNEAFKKKIVEEVYLTDFVVQ